MRTATPVRMRPKSGPRSATFLVGTNDVDTDAAAAAHFINALSSMQTVVDLSNVREARLTGTRRATAGAAGYTIELKYATAYTAAAGSFLQLGVTAISANASAANAIVDTGWVRITPAARTSVVVSPIASGGDGASDPNWGVVRADFR